MSHPTSESGYRNVDPESGAEVAQVLREELAVLKSQNSLIKSHLGELVVELASAEAVVRSRGLDEEANQIRDQRHSLLKIRDSLI